MILLLAEVKTTHLPNSQLVLASTVFLEYVQTALLAESAEKSRKLLFLCLHLIGLLQCINIRVCGAISKTNVQEMNMDRGKSDFQRSNRTFSRGKNADLGLIHNMIAV